MVNPTFLIASVLPTLAYASFTWTKCTNVPQCQNFTPVPSEGSGTGYTDFVYDSSNGYWYSHAVDGLFVSPEGYFQPQHDRNVVVIYSNDNRVGITHWSSHGNPCCLPDEVGTNIANVEAMDF